LFLASDFESSKETNKNHLYLVV